MNPPMSASQIGSPAPDADAGPKNGRPARKLWRWLGAGLLLLLILLIAFSARLWTQRDSLLERQAIVYLKSLGIDAELDIVAVSGTQIDIRDIRLRYDRDPFLRLERLRADYQWRDLLDGKVERLVFDGLDAAITIDEAGHIVDGWLPPSTGPSGSTFPPRGIVINRGAVTITSPYGVIPASFDADIQSLAAFEINGALDPTALTHGDMSANISGPFTLERGRTQSSDFHLTLPGSAVSLRHPSGSISQTQVSLKAAIDPAAKTVSGEAALSGGRINAAGMSAEIAALSVGGQYDGPKTQTIAINAALRQIAVSDPERRAALAEQLSLSGALSDVPAVQNFTPQISRVMSELLGGSDLNLALNFTADPNEVSAALREPLTLSAKTASATLSPPSETAPHSQAAPHSETNLYRYVRGSGQYDIRADLALSAPIPIRISPFTLTVWSDDGVSVGAVARAKGALKTESIWRSQTQSGEPARLDPLQLSFDYTAPVPASLSGPDTPGTHDTPAQYPQFSATGAIRYDGDIPGGYVTGLKAGGALTAILRPERTQMNAAARGPVSFDRLRTDSDWGIEDFSGTLAAATPLYRRQSAARSAVTATLSDAKFRAVRGTEAEGGPAQMALFIESAHLTGSLRGPTQDWDVDLGRTEIESATFPVADVAISMPDGELTASLSPQGRTTFDFRSSEITVQTPAYTAQDLSVQAAGTAEAFDLDFGQGRLRLTEGGWPEFPISGALQYADAGFYGSATTAWPKALDQPVSVNYRYADGRGHADVSIRDLEFRPGRLQPQDLAPALRGKIARVVGRIDADLDIQFGGDNPLSGTGTVDIKDMSLGTAPGPVTGLSGRVTLTSLFPIKTAPSQTLSVASFDPGFPLENGAVTYALVDTGVAIERAIWPLGDGEITLDPMVWTYGAAQNRVTLRVANVEIGEFLRDIGNGRLSVTGIIEGEIPVVIEGINVRVQGGRLEVKDGGTIKYTPEPGADLADRIGNPAAGQAFKALQDFRYQTLFAEIDGPLDGDLLLGLSFTGSNKDVLFDVPFAFDVTVEGELFNIARSLNPNGLGDRVISSVTAERAEQTP